MESGRRVLVIGAGYWGKKVIDEYVKLLDDHILDGLYVYDINRSLLNFQDNRIKTCTGLNEVLRDVSFAHVCTPNNTHFELVKTLLENNVETLVEKPITENVAEARELIKIAETQSVKLKVGMVYRFSSAINKTRELLRADVGEPRIVNASWLHNIDIPNIRRVMLERDVSWDIFIHLIDILNYILDMWPSFSFVTGIKSKSGLNHSLFAQGVIGGAHLSMRSSFISHMKERTIEIIGEKYNITLDFLNNTVILGNDDAINKFSFFDNPLMNEIRAFVGENNTTDDRNRGTIGLKEVEIISSLLAKSQKSPTEGR